MSLPYTEEDFISASECQRLIDYANANKKADVSRNDTYSTEVEWKDHGAIYFGNNLDKLDEERDQIFNNILNSSLFNPKKFSFDLQKKLMKIYDRK